MTTTELHLDPFITSVRAELLRQARHQEDLATDEAAHVPYWAATPATVLGHRAAAQALREAADILLHHGVASRCPRC